LAPSSINLQIAILTQSENDVNIPGRNWVKMRPSLTIDAEVGKRNLCASWRFLRLCAKSLFRFNNLLLTQRRQDAKQTQSQKHRANHLPPIQPQATHHQVCAGLG
jgi:hypothetical protein